MKIFQFHPLLWAGTPSSRPGYPSPVQPPVASSHRNLGALLPAQAQSWLCKMESPLQCFSFPIPKPLLALADGQGSARALPFPPGRCRCLPGASSSWGRAGSGGSLQPGASLPQETRLKIPGRARGSAAAVGPEQLSLFWSSSHPPVSR